MVILRGELCVFTDVSRDVSTGTFECSIQQVSSKTDCKNVIRKKIEIFKWNHQSKHLIKLLQK